jgi:hypothetical protein
MIRRRLGDEEDNRAARRMSYLFVGICVLFVLIVAAMIYFGWPVNDIKE